MLVRNTRIEEAPLRDELMLFDPESARFYVLNRTMAFVWRRLGDSPSIQSLVDALQTEFTGVDASRADADIRHALAELEKLGLATANGQQVSAPAE